MGKEKVEVLGMIFDKGEEPDNVGLYIETSGAIKGSKDYNY